MIVRVQLGAGRPVQRKGGKNRNLALACAALLTPMALMGYVLAFWRLAADMGMVAPYGFGGPFSHWQVALAAAALLHGMAAMLNRYGRHGEFRMPPLLKLHLLPPRAGRSERPALPSRMQR